MLGRGMQHLTPALRVLCIPTRNAGHNKWSNIRHVKGAKDIARGQKFAKIAKLMRLAIQEGGANPANNVRLENLIQQARDADMPTVTIQGVLRGTDQNADARPTTFELLGPGRCSLVVEVVTDNRRRCMNSIAQYLRKHRALFEQASHAFGRHGVVVATPPQPATDDLLDRATEHAIEAGAEDVRLEPADGGAVLVFSAAPDEVLAVRGALVTLGYQVQRAETLYVPRTTVTLTGDDARLHEALLHKLNEIGEVVQVWSNADVQA